MRLRATAWPETPLWRRAPQRTRLVFLERAPPFGAGRELLEGLALPVRPPDEEIVGDEAERPVGANRVAGSKLPKVESYVVDRTEAGIFDLFGSVREWTGDVDGDFAVVRGVALETTNPEAPALFATGSQKLVGSGPVDDVASGLIGLRCVR